MPNAPFTGRWAPVPVQAALDLARSKGPVAVLVWFAMLSDAARNGNWQTARPLDAVSAETGLNKNTVARAQAQLIEAGFAEVLSGGGKSRKVVTFAMTPVAHFNGNPSAAPQEPPPRGRGDWTS